jgi:hypothetical protein
MDSKLDAIRARWRAYFDKRDFYNALVAERGEMYSSPETRRASHEAEKAYPDDDAITSDIHALLRRGLWNWRGRR